MKEENSLIEDLMSCESDLTYLVASVEELVFGSEWINLECFDANGNPVDFSTTSTEIYCTGYLEGDIKTLEHFLNKNPEIAKKALSDIKEIVSAFKYILKEFTKP